MTPGNAANTALLCEHCPSPVTTIVDPQDVEKPTKKSDYLKRVILNFSIYVSLLWQVFKQLSSPM